jgi:hypothetical protein
VPDPNNFDGVVELGTRDGWTELPVSAGYPGAGRGAGVADLAAALAAGRPHRASAELAYHVLDIMESLSSAATAGIPTRLSSTCPVPDPVPLADTATDPAAPGAGPGHASGLPGGAAGASGVAAGRG